jgi:putative RecB family exonuclease
VALAVPTSLSPSKVSAFRDCALAFRLSAIDRLPEPPSAPAAKGTLVHRALELLLELPPAERTPDASRALLPQAETDVLDGEEYAELPLTPDERTAFVAQAGDLLEKYFLL